MTAVCFQSAAPPPPPPTALQAQLDAIPNGATLEIGSQHFVSDGPVFVRGGRSIHGNADAVVGVVPSTNRVWQTLIVNGNGTTLDGFQVVGNMPSGSGSNVAIEAQHGVEVQGCDDFLATNLYIHNVWGDAIAFQKDGAGNINNRSRIINCYADELGRCLFTPIAVNDLTVRQFNSGSPTNPFKTARINRAIVDIEPPGVSGWQCQNMLWHDCDMRKASGDNSTFVNRLGRAKDGDIANNVFDNLHMHGNSNFFAVFIAPADAAHGGPVRDGAYIFQSCGSPQPFGGAFGAFRAWQNDGLEIHDYQQTTTGGSPLYDLHDSTGPGGGVPLIDTVVVHQRADKTGEWYAYDDGTYWKWSN